MKGNRILLEKIGWVKTNEPLPVDCKYYNPRIKFDGKYWYLTVGVEVNPKIVKLEDRIVGVDVGIRELAVTSDGVFYENINKTASVRKAEKRLKRLQRRASRKYKKGTPKSKHLLKLEGEIRKQHRTLSQHSNQSCPSSNGGDCEIQTLPHCDGNAEHPRHDEEQAFG